jgi:hypothetical protein
VESSCEFGTEPLDSIQIDKYNTHISRQELTEKRLVKKLRKKLEQNNLIVDRLCGLVVRVLGYRFGGPGFDS